MWCGFCMANHFNSDIEFIPTSDIYSPDVIVKRLHQRWEIKTIRGNSKNTIEHAMHRAKLQSENLAISLYRSKMAPKVAIGRIKRELKLPNPFKRVILVTKNQKVVVIK